MFLFFVVGDHIWKVVKQLVWETKNRSDDYCFLFVFVFVVVGLVCLLERGPCIWLCLWGVHEREEKDMLLLLVFEMQKKTKSTQYNNIWRERKIDVLPCFFCLEEFCWTLSQR